MQIYPSHLSGPSVAIHAFPANSQLLLQENNRLPSEHTAHIIIRRRRSKHTRHLFSRETSDPPLFWPGHPLNGPRLLHQRGVQPRGNSRHNRPVIPREFSRRDRHRCGPPKMVRRIAQISRNLGGSRGSIVPDRCSVRGSDG